MAEVYIDSLTVKNFGPFYGEHVFNFGTLEDRMGILVGGKNGAGKTHLLRALYLAVVGETGVVDLKKVEPASESTRFNFDRALNRRAEAEGQDTVTLEIQVSQRDEKGIGVRRAKFVREIRFRPNSAPVWRSRADRQDGSAVLDDDKHIEKLRDALLPRHLARFFFFDAERGQNFSLGQQDIVEGISRILGLFAFGELENDLRQLIQNKIPRVFHLNSSEYHTVAKRLAEISGQIVTAEGELKALREEKTITESELSEARTELADVEERLKSLGAVDPTELEKAQEKRSELTAAKDKLEASLTSMWELALPLGLLGDYRKELYDKLLREEKRREWEASRATVEPKIPQIKHDVFGNPPNEFELDQAKLRFYSDRLDEALHKLFHPPPEGMADDCHLTDRNDRSAQIRHRLSSNTASLSEVAELCQRVEQVDSDLREADTKLRRLRQDAAAMSLGLELNSRRGELTAHIANLERRKSELSLEIEALDTKLRELRREETTQTALANRAKKGQNLTALAARYREAASEIRSRAAEQLRKKISDHVGEMWVEITEREKEFLGMEFDTRWKCFLLRRDGKRVSWEEANTSAGQRQVRMLAFYEALRRLAKIVPPLVVDTPLGRLDREVRDSVLDKLYLTGHQTVILTTNAEIDPDGPLFDRIKSKLARVYTLQPHGEEKSVGYQVSVTKDYFGRPL